MSEWKTRYSNCVTTGVKIIMDLFIQNERMEDEV
jgi:hypothetical protein